MKPRSPGARLQRGQSLLEFVIVVPAFLFLILGIFQFVLIYRAKATLDYAVLEAARSGAVHGAEMSSIRTGLARGLTPLYATDASVTGIALARAEAEIESRAYSRIQIISPTQAAWDNFAERQYDGRRALPNDNLAFRDTAIGSSGVNVQDANILKIRVVHQYRMIVPFVDRVIAGVSNLIRGDVFTNTDLSAPFSRYSRIPIESYAIVRMQSPIHDRSALGDAGGAGDPDHGNGGGPGPDPGDPEPGEPLPDDPIPPPPPTPGPGVPEPPACP